MTGDFALFAYGSLKRGHRNHSLLIGARFLREVDTAPGHHLVLLDEYPALAEGGDGVVHGELYLVGAELLARLDEFEGPEYVRREVRLATGSAAHAYFARHATDSLPRAPGGKWDRE